MEVQSSSTQAMRDTLSHSLRTPGSCGTSPRSSGQCWCSQSTGTTGRVCPSVTRAAARTRARLDTCHHPRLWQTMLTSSLISDTMWREQRSVSNWNKECRASVISTSGESCDCIRWQLRWHVVSLDQNQVSSHSPGDQHK